MAPNEEQTMILKARMGDGIAFGKLYKANVARIYAIVASHTKNKDDIDDLVQIAFIKAYQGLNRFRGDATFSTWLTRIAMNVCLSHCESQSVRRKWATYFHSPEGHRKSRPALHTRPGNHPARTRMPTPRTQEHTNTATTISRSHAPALCRGLFVCRDRKSNASTHRHSKNLAIPRKGTASGNHGNPLSNLNKKACTNDGTGF